MSVCWLRDFVDFYRAEHDHAQWNIRFLYTLISARLLYKKPELFICPESRETNSNLEFKSMPGPPLQGREGGIDSGY